ncbi:MAG TPA: hypothetical protein VFF45_00395 [Bacilli bacterium]|nr:hypothetical protein [Bacilli bacterium]
MPSAPQWKQRRLAVRAKRVQARRSADAPVIAAYGTTLGPKADEFIAAFDNAVRYETSRKKELHESKAAVALLHKQIRSWLPLLERDVSGFDAAAFDATPSVPDDVIQEGSQLAALLDESQGADGQPLPYRAEAIAAVNAALEAARKEWGEAEAAQTAYQQMLGAVRASEAAFDRELKAFRRSFLKTFGRQDKDYQRLRASRAAAPDEDDDLPAPPPPSAEAPPPSVSPPSAA